MSDSSSDSSSDGDNNNGAPWFSSSNYYLGLNSPRSSVFNPSLLSYPRPELFELSSSDLDSDNSVYYANYFNDSSSSDSDPPLVNLPDESDAFSDSLDGSFGSMDSMNSTIDSSPIESPHISGSSSSTIPFFNGINGENVNKIVTPKLNYWCPPKELYKREIGFYKNSTTWRNKFYQSLVAVQKLKFSKQLKGHKGCVNSLDFNTTGDLIASGSDDLNIGIWDWSKGKSLLKFNTAHTRNIFQTKFLITQGDIKIVSSARDGLIILSAINNCDVIYSKIIARHDRSCNKIGVHPELPYIVLSCGDDGVVKNIDIRESPINENKIFTNVLRIKNMHNSTMHLYGVDINPMNPHEFIVNGDDEFVRMYDKRKLCSGPVKLFRRKYPSTRIDDLDSIPFNSHITSAVYNYCGTEILASYSEDDIYLFDVNGPQKMQHIYSKHYGGHLNKMTVKGVNFYGPRSDYVISGSDCGHIFIWDKKSEIIVQKKFADTKGAVNVLEAHPHMPTLATSGIESTIKIWEPLNTAKEPKRFKLRTSVVHNMVEREIRRGLQSVPNFD